ncbi:hypothetical protein [Sorangium sp. So ce341]|uniref:hypothetical protein n=1 Tax=Sorangium sp. So ce341 TaxID=3133302 RepID=UPI003F60C68E
MGRENVSERRLTDSWVGHAGRWIAMAVGLLLATTSCSDHIVEELSDEEIDAVEDALSARAGQHAFGISDGINEAGEPRQLAPLWTSIESRSFPPLETLRADWKENNDGDKWSLRSARTIFHLSYDHKKTKVGLLKRWIEAVKNAGIDEPYVTISVLPDYSDNTKIPVTVDEFSKGFKKLLHNFSTRRDPKIIRWGIVNEPDRDLPGDGPEQARIYVDYYIEAHNVLRQCKKDRKCSDNVMLIAGEFASQSTKTWKRVARQMAKAIDDRRLRRFPRIWALHAYRDTIEGNARVTKRFSNFLRDWETKSALDKFALRAWITESGTILHSGRGCTSLNDDPRAQYRGASTVFNMNGGANNKELVSRVDRIYWWNFRQSAWPQNNNGDKLEGHAWDSALVDYHGFKRPSYCALTNPGKSYRDPSVQGCMNLHPPSGEPRVELAAVQCNDSRETAGVDPSPSEVEDSPSPDVEDPPSHPVYRWWNGGSFGDHFYTTDHEGEIAPDVGYMYEGVGFRTFTCDTPGTKPFFRWWSERLTDHFYTTDPSGELAPAAGYIPEGDIGCVASAPSQDTMALHRWWNPSIGDHFYTLDPNGELAPTSGYQYEGIAGYVLPPE